MRAQDKTEQVLREIYLMLSQCETYEGAGNCIIVNKKELLELLKSLNISIYGLMEEYEMTQQTRDAAERALRRKSDEIVEDARNKAEDVYAASVLYTDEALRRVQDIMQTATDSIRDICSNMDEQLKKEKATVHQDQSELKALLEGMAESEKYTKLMEETNRKLQKEKEKETENEEPEVSAYAAAKPEIKINAEYFEKAGISVEEETSEEEEPEQNTEQAAVQVNVNLDAEYFKWKEEPEEEEPEKKQERRSLFGKKLK